MLQFGASLTDNTNIVNYNHNMFIILATGQEEVTLISNAQFQNVNYLPWHIKNQEFCQKQAKNWTGVKCHSVARVILHNTNKGQFFLPFFLEDINSFSFFWHSNFPFLWCKTKRPNIKIPNGTHKNSLILNCFVVIVIL